MERDQGRIKAVSRLGKGVIIIALGNVKKLVKMAFEMRSLGDMFSLADYCLFD